MRNLEKIFDKYGIKINENQQKMFDSYFQLLITKNKVMNLTAIIEENDVLIKHFLDSVITQNIIPQNSTIVDVGSGAGFPAIPLKIVRPDIRIYMVDSLNKRVDFLKEVVSMLNITNSYAIHERAEEYAKTNREKFDVAVARAVASLNTLVEYLLPLVKVGGIAVIYKSTKIEDELKDATKAINILGGKVEQIKKYNLEGFERSIIVIKKINLTPLKYPRGQNKPKTNPII